MPAFLYTVEELERSFPAVKSWPSPQSHDSSRNRLKGDAVKLWWAKVLKKHRKAPGPLVAKRLTSYLIHEPSLVLWARDRMRTTRLKAGRGGSGAFERRDGELPAFVWVIEDDAVFLGDLGGFIRLFHPPSPPPSATLSPATPSSASRQAAGASSARGGLVAPDADLVSTFANLEGSWIEASSHDWKVNDAFSRLYADRRVHKWEHVERFSSRLIQALDSVLTREGAAAHGEMFASTVCLATAWCVASDLRAARVVAVDASLYGPSASVLTTSERWERQQLFETHRSWGAPGVWLHSVKNVCNALSLWSNATVRVSADDPQATFVLASLGEDSPPPQVPLQATDDERMCTEPRLAAEQEATRCDDLEPADALAGVSLQDQEEGVQP